MPDKVSAAPPVAVARLADQLAVDPAELRSYGRRAKTRTEHLRLVAKYLGWRLPTTLELKELDEFLLARALKHDSPTLLFRLACEYLISARVIRPGPVTAVERVAHARAEAQRETFDRLAHEFTEQRCTTLDGLLVTDPEIRTTRLRWLSTGPVETSPAAVKAEVAKLEFLRSTDADSLDLSVLPAERRRFLATVGRRLTAQALERRDPQRRYPILLTLPAQSATDVLDEVVQLFDQAVSARESKAERKMRDALAERGKAGEDRQALLDDLLDIIFDLGLDDEQIGGLIRGERIGWPRLRSAREQGKPRLPRDHGHRRTRCPRGPARRRAGWTQRSTPGTSPWQRAGRRRSRPSWSAPSSRSPGRSSSRCAPAARTPPPWPSSRATTTWRSSCVTSAATPAGAPLSTPVALRDHGSDLRCSGR